MKYKTHFTETFDASKIQTYVGHWCLWRKTYEHSYTKIFVHAIKDGIVKYSSENGNTIYVDCREFDNCIFFVSPFDQDESKNTIFKT